MELSEQQKKDIALINQQRALGNYTFGGNIGASNPGATAWNLSKTQAWTAPPATNNTSNSNNNNNVSGVENVDWFTNEFGQRQAINKNGGGSSGPSQSDIDSAFAPLYDTYKQAEDTLRGGYSEDIGNVDKRYGNYNKQYEEERGRLTGEVTDKQTDFQTTLRSALQDAVRSYNALKQQKMSRFGGGSSAGEAVGELASQEYFKQQGNVQQEGLRGEREFAKEFANIGQFIAQKKSELDMWKEESLTELKKNLNTQLANIQAQRNQTESDKAQARISIVQDSINRARAIQDQDTQFRQQLAIAGVNQLQTSAGRTFTPQEIQAYVTEFMGGNTAISSAKTSSASYTPSYNKNTAQEDELARLQGVV
jgi:hypothetical protein